MARKKVEFMEILFKQDKAIGHFADCFYHNSQIFTGAGVLTERDIKIALQLAITPYQDLYCAMIPGYYKSLSTTELLGYLWQVGKTYGPPN